MGDPRRILIVEDEALIAMLLGDMVEDLGHVVHQHCETLDEAREAAQSGGFDLAILDIHLGQDDIWPVAEILRDQGVPILLASGGHIAPPPSAFADAPVVAKPYSLELLGKHLEEAFANV